VSFFSNTSFIACGTLFTANINTSLPSICIRYSFSSGFGISSGDNSLLSYLLFKPVRKLLEDRKQRVADEQESAKNDRKEAAVYKEEYEQKLKEIDKEAQAILSEARKKAMKTENEIVAEAKEEAARIITRANNEIELERKRALDDMKQEMISIASAMAGKVVAASIDTSVQDELIEETLKEMGEQTWLS